MHTEYIEQRNGGYYVAGTRISLDSVVYSFNDGQSPEAIQQDFPSLRLSQVYGAIAFYLDHKAEIDKCLEDAERESKVQASRCRKRIRPFGSGSTASRRKWMSPGIDPLPGGR